MNWKSIARLISIGVFLAIGIVPLAVKGQTDKWPTGKEYREDYILSKIDYNLYVHGRGNIFLSSDGGETWQQLVNADAPDLEKVSTCLWQESDTLFYEVLLSPGLKYFYSTDRVEWMPLPTRIMRWVPYNSILGLSRRVDIDSLTHLRLVSTFDTGTGQWRTGVYRGNEGSIPVLDLPVVVDTARPKHPWNYPAPRFSSLQYLPNEGIVLAYLEGAGLFCSCDAGQRWERREELAPEREIVGFCEWKNYVVVVLTDGSTVRIEKEKLCGEQRAQVSPSPEKLH